MSNNVRSRCRIIYDSLYATKVYKKQMYRKLSKETYGTSSHFEETLLPILRHDLIVTRLITQTVMHISQYIVHICWLLLIGGL